MTDLAARRLRAQGLEAPHLPTAVDVVERLVAVQAQDVRAALWAVGLRTAGATEASVAAALADRRVVRTWPLRGTLHLVPAADVRWMLAHLAPRVLRQARRRYRELGLDEAAFAAAADAVVEALEGGRSLPRDAMYAAFEAAGVPAESQRGYHVLFHLAHTGLICVGAPADGAPTFALLEEWAAPAPVPPRDEALAGLAARYVAGHGPATDADFAWWAGLTLTDARRALASTALVRDEVDGQAVWRDPDASAPGEAQRALLLPVYDELTVGFADRSAVLDPADGDRAGNGIFRPVIVVDGRVVGTWRRTLRAGAVRVERSPFEGLEARDERAVEAAAARYAAFLERDLVLA